MATTAIRIHRKNGRHNVIGVLQNMDSPAITVRQERCAMVRNRNAGCMKCADACTSGCIHLEDGLLRVDASKCVGCGTCATVCPTCALEAHAPTDDELLAQCRKAARDGHVAIACRPFAQACAGLVSEEALARVVCLGRVEESLLARLAARGINSVALLCGNCERCAQKKGRACAEMVAASATDLLRAWGNEMAVDVTGIVPPQALAEGAGQCEVDEAVARFFEGGYENQPVFHLERMTDDHLEVGSTKTIAETDAAEERREVLRVMKDGTLPHFVPDRRERLLDALDRLGEPSSENISSRLWGRIVIDLSKCVSCRMCSTFCPTGAIARFDDEDGTMGVSHFPADCVKCGTCRDICPVGAIRIFDEVRARSLLEGEVQRYPMRPRPVRMNDPHQILETMRGQVEGHVYER